MSGHRSSANSSENASNASSSSDDEFIYSSLLSREQKASLDIIANFPTV